MYKYTCSDSPPLTHPSSPKPPLFQPFQLPDPGGGASKKGVWLRGEMLKVHRIEKGTNLFNYPRQQHVLENKKEKNYKCIPFHYRYEVDAQMASTPTGPFTLKSAISSHTYSHMYP
jgi:hypothetical protein